MDVDPLQSFLRQTLWSPLTSLSHLVSGPRKTTDTVTGGFFAMHPTIFVFLLPPAKARVEPGPTERVSKYFPG